MDPAPASLGRQVLMACESLGFASAGFIAARPSDWSAELHAWLGAGKHGDMEWLAGDADVRLDPSRVLPGAKTVIVVADQYAERGAAGGEAGLDSSTACAVGSLGRIARYAQGLDYHGVIRKRLHTLADALRALHPEHEFRTFVDTAPVMEREHSARAGLGWIGKHTLLIHPARGSYLLLGGILTTLELTPDSTPAMTDHCGSCTRCIDACPTRAITPYSVDATRCISYLTIEHRGRIDAGFHEAMGEWVFGCDICQDVCPYNQERAGKTGVSKVDRVHPAYSPRTVNLPLLEVLGWSEEDRTRAFSGSAMKRVTLEMLKRNVLVALGNAARGSHDDALIERIREIAADANEPDLVRVTAADVMASLIRGEEDDRPDPPSAPTPRD